MNKKGQALIEFIIILPIFIMILLAACDYVRIMQVKMRLETEIENVILDSGYKLDEDTLLEKSSDNNIAKYNLSEKVEIYSPLLTPVISSTYQVKVERKVYEK